MHLNKTAKEYTGRKNKNSPPFKCTYRFPRLLLQMEIFKLDGKLTIKTSYHLS
jgi:hypothetical protein